MPESGPALFAVTARTRYLVVAHSLDDALKRLLNTLSFEASEQGFVEIEGDLLIDLAYEHDAEAVEADPNEIENMATLHRLHADTCSVWQGHDTEEPPHDA